MNSQLSEGAVSVLKAPRVQSAEATEETGVDRPAAPFISRPAVSPATEKCALATTTALEATERACNALELVEERLDQMRRQAAVQEQLRAELVKTREQLQQSIRELNRMAVAFIERMPK